MKKGKKGKILKRIGKIFLGFLIFFIVLILVIRTPWAQNFIVSKITAFVADKIDTKFTIDNAFITFSGDILLEKVYLEDKKGDTLFYSNSLQLDLPIYPILANNELNIDDVISEGLVANVKKGTNPEVFNFSFLVDAFVSTTYTTTTTEPMRITLGDFSLKNWKIKYNDDYLGTDLKLKIGQLETSFNGIDFPKMKYEIANINLANSSLIYTQHHAFPISTDTPEAASIDLPYLTIGDLNINDLVIHYTDKPDGIDTSLSLAVLSLSDILADVSKNQYETNDFIFKNSEVVFNSTTATTTELQNKPPSDFVWPEFILSAENIALEKNTIRFTKDGASPTTQQFNPDAFEIQQLQLKATDFAYKPENFNINLTDFSFLEPSGIHLEQFKFAASLTEKQANINNLALRLNQNTLNANLAVNFSSLNEAFNNPQESYLSAALNNLNIEVGAIQKLLPEFANDSYLMALAKKPITGNILAKGSLKNIENLKTNLFWGTETSITASGSVANPTQTDSLRYDFENIRIVSSKNDLQQFISSEDLGISIPEKLTITSVLLGTTSSVKTNTTILIPEGLASVNGAVTFGKETSFNGALKIDSLQVGKLLQNEQLGALSLQIKGAGTGSDLPTLNAKLKGTISQFQLNGYSYENIEVDGEILKGSGTVLAAIKDPNLNLTSTTTIDLNADITDVKLTSKIIGADLKKLGFTTTDIKIAAAINGSYSGNPSNFSIGTTIDQGIAVTDNEQYQVGLISLQAKIEDSITDVSIASNFINGEVYSNASPTRVTEALKQQLTHYFSTDTVSKTSKITDTVKAKLKFSLKPTPILSNVFLNGFTDLDSLTINADFDSKQQRLYAEVTVPKISYAGSSIDSLNILLNGDAADLRFSAGIGDLTYDPIHLKQTYIEGQLKNKELVLDFNVKNDSLRVMHIASELKFQKDTLRLHIDPTELILNKEEWDIPFDNSIVLADSFMDVRNLILSRNKQKLEISTAVSKMQQEHIGVLFENFTLQTFLSLFNPDEVLAKGKVQGDFILLNPFKASGLVSDIQIENFEVMGNPLGTLALNASSKSLSNYDFDLALRDGDANLSLTGDYRITENDAALNMELDIKELKMSVLQGFFKEELSNPKGYLSGSMLVGGTLSNPKYAGSINFEGTELTLTQFNTSLAINNQTVAIDQDKISFSKFNITDNAKGALILDGNIDTENTTNPLFNFSIKADKFRVLNSKKGDNELVYGEASINADLKVSGDLDLPVINGKLRIRDITDLTYVLPQEELDIQERDGVVIFVNKEDSDVILTRNNEKNSNSVFAGININTTLEIANEAKFTVVLDEKTGDMLQASGKAALNLNIDANSDMRLSGRLELNDGFYRTSLYNLVSREFKIKNGSTVVWSGDPYDAKLDVTAIYEIETSPASLMSSISAGSESSGSYQQATDFLVYLNVEGQLTNPELSFGLDMPEKEQGNFGGAVYSRIQQLNEQESELNKQVFSLLALNRFYPTTGSDGSNGGAISLARNNVNKVLSGELNAISNKILGNSGFELGFDLDSFEDYESGNAESRTQLNINASKTLFNDRLIVTAGSALDVEGSAASEDSATPIIGNVTLEYLLTEEGTYRLKGFRKQEYQNIIDGQLIITGIAFIFNREFNKFSELFAPVEKRKKKYSKPKKKKTDTEN